MNKEWRGDGKKNKKVKNQIMMKRNAVFISSP
jgi:hypothetical protein